MILYSKVTTETLKVKAMCKANDVANSLKSAKSFYLGTASHYRNLVQILDACLCKQDSTLNEDAIKELHRLKTQVELDAIQHERICVAFAKLLNTIDPPKHTIEKEIKKRRGDHLRIVK